MRLYSQEVQPWIDDVQVFIEELCAYQLENKPKPPFFFIHFLYRMLCSCSIPSDRSRTYGVATTLLKIGLDRHIQNNHQAMDVLIGDYFSIQFYCLLSEHGEVDGIRHIAQTISRINEWRMEQYLWMQGRDLYDDLSLQRVKHISSALTLAVAQFFEDQLGLDKEYWNRIILSVFLLNEVYSAPYSLTRSGEKYIQRTHVELQEAISHLKSTSLQEDLVYLFQYYSIFSVKEGEACEHSLCSR